MMHMGVMAHYVEGSVYPVGGSGAIPRKLNAVVLEAGVYLQATIGPTSPGPHATLMLTSPGTHATLMLTSPGPHATLMLTSPGTHATLMLTSPGTHGTLAWQGCSFVQARVLSLLLDAKGACEGVIVQGLVEDLHVHAKVVVSGTGVLRTYRDLVLPLAPVLPAAARRANGIGPRTGGPAPPPLLYTNLSDRCCPVPCCEPHGGKRPCQA